MRTVRGVMAAVVAAAAWMALAETAVAATSEAEWRRVDEEVRQAAKKGPVDVPLADQAVLHLPDGELFVPQPQAARLLNAMGNPGDYSSVLGIVLPGGERHEWFMPVRFHAAGYVKDEDAKNWDADGMLASFREGAEEDNKARVKAGDPALEIVGWAESPRYDPATQRLVWALSSRDVGAPADAPKGVNYNTYALGRDGYFSLNMVTGLDGLDALKPVAAQQLAALEYRSGKRYADFNDKTDHVAEYGLAALVVGVAAHKLGFIAVVGLFLAKFAKIILIALAAFGGGFMRFFKRKPEPGATAPAPQAPAGPAFVDAAADQTSAAPATAAMAFGFEDGTPARALADAGAAPATPSAAHAPATAAAPALGGAPGTPGSTGSA